MSKPDKLKTPIEVIPNGRGGYKVRWGEYYEGQLSSGEALECVARILFGPREHIPYLRHVCQHRKYAAKMRRGLGKFTNKELVEMING